ncbi:MAG: hypothetical protein R2851_01780 [Caldilineaceae bacterium]
MTLLHGILRAHYPYYINYYNPLLGGKLPPRAHALLRLGRGVGTGGGMVNQQPEATELHAIPGTRTVALVRFDGKASGVDYGSRINRLDADYLVLYVNQIQRDIHRASRSTISCAGRSAFTVTLDGIVMARVYDLHALLDNLAEQAPDPDEYDVAHTWPDVQVTHFETLTSTPISSALPVELRFQGKADATQASAAPLQRPGGTRRPAVTCRWPTKWRSTLVPPDAVPGPYQLRMMIYDEETLEPIRTTDGADLVTLIDLDDRGVRCDCPI